MAKSYEGICPATQEACQYAGLTKVNGGYPCLGEIDGECGVYTTLRRAQLVYHEGEPKPQAALSEPIELERRTLKMFAMIGQLFQRIEGAIE